MKRASYRDAVAWVAVNDSAADGADLEVVESYISTILVADIFDVEVSKVAADVVAYRKKGGLV